MRKVSLAGRRAWSLAHPRLDHSGQRSLTTDNLILIVFAALRPLLLQKDITLCFFILDVLVLEKMTKSFKSNETVRFFHRNQDLPAHPFMF